MAFIIGKKQDGKTYYLAPDRVPAVPRLGRGGDGPAFDGGHR
jgi:hypothetical protein